MRKHCRVFIFLLLLTSPLFSQDLYFNPWELIIYRPDDNREMNQVWCWLKLEDAETGEDVTYKKAKATYEWISQPDIKNNYKKSYYLSSGMAMHLNLEPGKYIISFYTPADKISYFPCENKNTWESNKFYYDTENPAKVIFVFPTTDDNGFYNGGWEIDWKAPKFYKFSIPSTR